MLDAFRERARRLKRDLAALSLASRDPRVPWYAKGLIVGVVAYALSPIDLIPDAIPVFGYLDDLVLVPLGIATALRMIPPEVMADCRAKAAHRKADATLLSWVVAGVIVALWLALAVAAAWVAWRAWAH